ncbi:CsbD family protein [Cellulomonas persica]|uniref:CsbD family protein n=1 Tax=Cellulomonas persica TaxID=76861 RepID=UPI001C996A32|nr:CsbD family protein [Cellulomonas persica]
MGFDDKVEHKGEEVKGKAEELAGKATGDRDLEAEGKGDQTAAKIKQVGDDVKDVFR